MESSRSTLPKPESGDKDSTTGKKKKTAEAIGASIIEPKKSERSAEKSPESLWERLIANGSETKKVTDNDEEKVHDAPLPEHVPIDELSPDEKTYIEQEIIQDLQTQPMAETLNVDQENAAPSLAVASFRHKIIVEHQDSETAFADTLSEIIASEAAEPEISNKPNKEIPEEPEDMSTVPAETEEDKAPPAAVGSSSGGSALTPPNPPGYGPAARPPQPPQANGPGANGYNPNIPPPVPGTTQGPNVISLDDAYYYERQAQNRGLLVGGIIGYLIGRRRGRIKTEKRLLPVQRKLEKEVKQLQDDIFYKEAVIRRTATEHATTTLKSTARPEQPTAATSEQTAEQKILRPVALEANQLHGKKLSSEHIGQVIVSEQARPPKILEQPEAKPAKLVDKASTEKQVEVMSRTELLTLSEKIVINGANLRQIYETHLVGERGLRRLVTEYLRGGDINKLLRRELVEREIDFERDPILRDKAPHAVASSGAATALNNLLQEAGALTTEDEAEEGVLKARAKYEATVISKQKQRRQIIDSGFAAVVVILLALIVFLILTRR